MPVNPSNPDSAPTVIHRTPATICVHESGEMVHPLEVYVWLDGLGRLPILDSVHDLKIASLWNWSALGEIEANVQALRVEYCNRLQQAHTGLV